MLHTHRCVTRGVHTNDEHDYRNNTTSKMSLKNGWHCSYLAFKYVLLEDIHGLIIQGMIFFTTTITINIQHDTEHSMLLDVVMAACSHGLPPKDPRLWLSFSLLLLRLRRRWYIASTT